MNKINSKPRLLKELAKFYNVDERTFKDWLNCNQLKHIVKNKKGYYFTINEINIIIEHLGEP